METIPDFQSYDHIIVAFSGGKDSVACLLRLLEENAPKQRIELWHHCIDGKSDRFMDWPVTEQYCKSFAQAFGLPIYFSWKHEGFLGELYRNDSRTKATSFETPDGVITVGGERGKKSTRLKFPAKTANLQTRWCSAYLKIDVADRALKNQERFVGKRTLFLTGERAEESPARSQYKEFEPHRADSRNGKRIRRHIDHWRAVHGWSEQQIWDLYRKYKINPHPSYKLGWGRTSCAGCIFGSKNQWASLKRVLPEQYGIIREVERDINHTIDNKLTIEEMAADGEAYDASYKADIVAEARAERDFPIFVADWKLPAGAFGESCGPI